MANQPADDDGEQDAQEERQAAFDRQISKDLKGAKPAILFGIIPLTLVLVTLNGMLTSVLGDWIQPILSAMTPFFILAFFGGIPVWYLYRRRLDSDLPFLIPGHGRFMGERKKRLLRGGALVLIGVVVLAPLGNLLLGYTISHLREFMLGWTLPWPW